MHNPFIIFLLFVTAWIILILAAKYLGKRDSLPTYLHHQPPPAPEMRALPAGGKVAGRTACCLEVPCSDECAREHQAMRDRLAQRYDLVAAEALKVIGKARDPLDN